LAQTVTINNGAGDGTFTTGGAVYILSTPFIQPSNTFPQFSITKSNNPTQNCKSFGEKEKSFQET